MAVILLVKSLLYIITFDNPLCSGSSLPHKTRQYPLDYSIFIDIITISRFEKPLVKLEASPDHVRYSDLCKVCDRFFGRARQPGTSHRVYRTPWVDDPRLNIQERRGMAKAYQVRQVIAAIKRLEEEHEPEE